MCRQGSVLGVLGVLGVWSLANGRLECPNKRGLCAGKGQAAMLERWRPGAWWKLPRGMCRQRAGCNPGAAKADGQAWWKLPRTFKARAEKFHTCGGPRRRPGLGTTTHLRPEEMADCFGTNGTDCPARCGWLKDVPRQHMWWAKAEPLRECWGKSWNIYGHLSAMLIFYWICHGAHWVSLGERCHIHQCVGDMT